MSRDLGIPVDELKNRVTSTQITEYEASYTIDPPYGRLIVRMLAQLTALTFNLHKSRRERARSAYDFWPEEWKEQAQAQAQAPIGPDLAQEGPKPLPPSDDTKGLETHDLEQANALWGGIKAFFTGLIKDKGKE